VAGTGGGELTGKKDMGIGGGATVRVETELVMS